MKNQCYIRSVKASVFTNLSSNIQLTQREESLNVKLQNVQFFSFSHDDKYYISKQFRIRCEKVSLNIELRTFHIYFNARRQQNKISAYQISSPSHWTWFAQTPFGGKQSKRWVKEEQAKVEWEYWNYCRKMRECFRDWGKTSKVNAQKILIASCLPIENPNLKKIKYENTKVN